MADKLVNCLEQMSPLMDSAAKLMRSMELNPSEHIALGFLVCADFSMRAALSMPQIDEELTDEQRECILNLLAKKKREADEIMQAAAAKFLSSRWTQ